MIIEDPDEIWRMGVNVFERYNGPYNEEMKPFVEIMLQKWVAVSSRSNASAPGITASWVSQPLWDDRPLCCTRRLGGRRADQLAEHVGLARASWLGVGFVVHNADHARRGVDVIDEGVVWAGPSSRRSLR